MAKDNKNSPIFLLSLVDFFIQITFLFVILFCIYLTNKSTIDEKIKIFDKTKEASEYHGYKNPIDLINDLTSLSPTNFSKLSELLKNYPQQELSKVFEKISPAELNELLKRAGSKEALFKAVDQQFGDMPCKGEYEELNGRIIPKRIATFYGDDTHIKLVNKTAIFEELLQKYNISVEVNESISLNEFKVRFSPLSKNNRKCRSYVNFRENTNLKFARDSLGSIFNYW